jgi:SPFH domain/Band 7 family protein
MNNDEQNPAGNAYLNQVLQQQAQVDQELRPRKMKAPAPPATPAAAARRPTGRAADEFAISAHGASEPPAGRAVDYRITGWWRWRTVVVPPNVYVVHTRRGYKEPIDIGVGISFRFDPAKDAFLVIPAAMQTIIINANCICAERQGVLVQAYVQWGIVDIATAYRKLDFSDPEDPMRIVNVQLREQAEAAIKDKVATMPIDEILSDKQPIIEELTHRLRAVAEGSRQGQDASGGLGLQIVTVQIKEAVVSSVRVWESLQKPFRADRQMMARMAELQAERSITSRELEIRKANETAHLQTEAELAQLRAAQERERYDREQSERLRRHKLEQEAEQRRIAETNATARVTKEAELELALAEIEMESRKLQRQMERIRLQIGLDGVLAERTQAQAEAEASVEELRHKAKSAMEERDTIRFRERRAVENDLSESHLRARLIEKLPEIAQAIPAPQELRTLSITSDGASGGPTASLAGLLASVLALAEGFKRPPQTPPEK